MKKYLYLLMVAMFASFSFALTSCGDDDDEPDGGGSNGGKVSVVFDGAATESYDVWNATYAAIVMNRGNVTFNAKLGEWGDMTELQFTTITPYEDLQKGQKIELRALHFETGVDATEGTYFTDEYSGTATVSAISNGKITLKLDNLKFDRAYEGRNGTTYQKVTINGTITYTDEQE